MLLLSVLKHHDNTPTTSNRYMSNGDFSEGLIDWFRKQDMN
jgi:hypothetical protein